MYFQKKLRLALLSLGLFHFTTATFGESLDGDIKNPNKGSFLGCPSQVDYNFPSITITPFANVVVGDSEEFEVIKTPRGVRIVHTGVSEFVRFPSIVAINREVELVLSQPQANYCVISAVASFGGEIRIESNFTSDIRIVSAVGNVQY